MELKPETRKAARLAGLDIGTAATGGAAGGLALDWLTDLLNAGDLGVVVFGVVVVTAIVFGYLARRRE